MGIIDAVDFREIDLNLLVSLRVLLAEHHVTRAAERLGITQPAMSASLARLRVLFNDQLLVRGPKGMAPTPRAEQLSQQLEQTMAVIEQMIALPAKFDPATSKRTFSLIGTDLIEALLLPPLMALLAVEAPHIQVAFRPPNPKNLESLLSEGEIDLAIGYLPEAPQNLITSLIFHDPLACIARTNHPQLSEGSLSLDNFVDLGHVQALPRDFKMYAAPIDTALGALGLVRRVVLWQPSFVPIPAVVANTDLIAVVPTRLAVRAAQTLPIVVYEPPLPLPDADFALYWHARSREDAGQKWLRGKVLAVLRS